VISTEVLTDCWSCQLDAVGPLRVAAGHHVEISVGKDTGDLPNEWLTMKGSSLWWIATAGGGLLYRGSPCLTMFSSTEAFEQACGFSPSGIHFVRSFDFTINK